MILAGTHRPSETMYRSRSKYRFPPIPSSVSETSRGNSNRSVPLNVLESLRLNKKDEAVTSGPRLESLSSSAVSAVCSEVSRRVRRLSLSLESPHSCSDRTISRCSLAAVVSSPVVVGMHQSLPRGPLPSPAGAISLQLFPTSCIPIK